MSQQSDKAPAFVTKLTPENHHNKPEEHEEDDKKD
tara:strand:+ start:486 stop:590 length:105 start_codon:yes stop_codon:yes gene_type:complete